MSVLTVTPTADTIVELEGGKDYVVIYVNWEYSSSAYLLPIDLKNPPSNWLAYLKLFVPRDEGATIEAVKFL